MAVNRGVEYDAYLPNDKAGLIKALKSHGVNLCYGGGDQSKPIGMGFEHFAVTFSKPVFDQINKISFEEWQNGK